MNEKLSAFLKAMVKYGGGNLIILILGSWYFNAFFDIDPNAISDILTKLLYILFFETIYVLIVSRACWTIGKIRSAIKGEEIAELDGKALDAVGKELGLDVLQGALSVAKSALTSTPIEKEKKVIEKEIEKIEKELVKFGLPNE